MRSAWSIPYGGTAPLPYWGAQTSHVNFCEEDFVVVRYVAEFINTLTSLAYILYGYHGIRRYKRNEVKAFSTINLPYWGLIGVGIFSGLYHSTLKYHTQMADEMSMHLAMGCVLIQLWTFEQPPDIQRRNAGIIVLGLVSFVTYHCVTDEFVLHVVLFVGLSVSVVWKTRAIIRERVKEKAYKERMGTLATFATATALFAYFLWNLDNIFCPTLTRWKRHLGMPWGVLLELHGWWHILTAVSSYAFMAQIEFLTSPEHDQSHGMGFAWPAKAILKDIVPKPVADVVSDGNANGHTNGQYNGYLKKRHD